MLVRPAIGGTRAVTGLEPVARSGLEEAKAAVAKGVAAGVTSGLEHDAFHRLTQCFISGLCPAPDSDTLPTSRCSGESGEGFRRLAPKLSLGASEVHRASVRAESGKIDQWRSQPRAGPFCVWVCVELDSDTRI